MINRIILLACICIVSCENDTNKPYDITISGIVSDQVTKQPIVGATVSCGIIPGLLEGNLTHYIEVLKPGGASFSIKQTMA